MSGKRETQRDARLSGEIAAWFVEHARELPWRVRPGRTATESRGAQRLGARRDPYRALVSEAMLQQTQVSRVVGKFEAFVARFPTVESLAAADEHDVLEMWSGLGYYRRARSLHAAAKMIVSEFDGRVPADVECLRKLPGVGRYTAGSISSIVFGMAAPIVDGNVARVLLRIHGKDAASDDKAVQGWLWERADSLVRASGAPGEFNEGLMELGAVVCVPPPAAPKCEECPVRARCAARRAGTQLDIPRPKKRATRAVVHCAVAIVEREDGALLVERRGSDGMWAGLWQAPTIEDRAKAVRPAALARELGLPVRDLAASETMEFLATHRRMLFSVHRAKVNGAWKARRGVFKSRAEIARLGLGSIQRRVLLGE